MNRRRDTRESTCPGPYCVLASNGEHDGGGPATRRPADQPAGAHTHGTGGAHPHDRGHAHEHDHLRLAGRRGLYMVAGLTGTFMVVEFIGGVLANSLALMADAGHMLTDVAAISLSLFAIWFAQRPATDVKTFGYLRWEILAALINGATLLLLSFFIFVEAWERFREPAHVESSLMLGVAVAGLLVNVSAAIVLHRSAGHSLNIRGAYIHVLGDLLGSLGAIAAAIVILTTGWLYADPLISVLVGLLILVSSWKLVRESVDILLESVPAHIDLEAVRHAIAEIPGVDAVHDLHVWTVTSGYLAMSGHAVVEDPLRNQAVLEEIDRRMRDHFGIDHVTFQLERHREHPGNHHA